MKWQNNEQDDKHQICYVVTKTHCKIEQINV
jgi:hypothetical protein